MLKPHFIKALDQVQEEKGISKQSLLSLVESALATAYRRAFNPPDAIRVQVDPGTAEIAIFGRRRVVEQVSDPGTEVSLDEAKAARPGVEPGQVVEVPLPTDDFARLAAQISKQVVFQRLRDAEKEQVLRDVLEHKGEMVSGVVERIADHPDGKTVYLELGKAEGVLAPEEQIPDEVLRPGQYLKVLLLDERKRGRGAQVNVSRAHKALVRRLLEFEIPELQSGAVIIRALARERGGRPERPARRQADRLADRHQARTCWRRGSERLRRGRRTAARRCSWLSPSGPALGAGRSSPSGSSSARSPPRPGQRPT